MILRRMEKWTYSAKLHYIEHQTLVSRLGSLSSMEMSYGKQTYVSKDKGVSNRPGVAQRVPACLGSHISRHSAREGGEVSLTHRPPIPAGMFLVLIFTRGWVNSRAMVRSEGNMSLKNPVTSPGIDTGTVRLVAQCLNHYATTGPQTYVSAGEIWYWIIISPCKGSKYAELVKTRAYVSVPRKRVICQYYDVSDISGICQ